LILCICAFHRLRCGQSEQRLPGSTTLSGILWELVPVLVQTGYTITGVAGALRIQLRLFKLRFFSSASTSYAAYCSISRSDEYWRECLGVFICYMLFLVVGAHCNTGEFLPVTARSTYGVCARCVPSSHGRIGLEWPSTRTSSCLRILFSSCIILHTHCF
jgi:hypothetical protein